MSMILPAKGGAARFAARIFTLLLLVSSSALGWGGAAHRLINLKACMHLPPAMAALRADSLYYEAHASDPDNRKDYSDTSFFAESQRHYIDIDNYPNFRTLPHSLDSVISLYGRSFVRDQGTLPWIVPILVDSLTERLRRGNIAAAESVMSDIGHYVGDAHQPLHATVNYNGTYTGNNGIHSRYESSMISIYLGEISVVQDSARYIASPLDFMFGIIMHSNSLVDSVLAADTYAKTASIWNGSGSAPPEYYAALWEKTQAFTKDQIQHATTSLASLWYTAFVNAQGPNAVLNDDAMGQSPVAFTLLGNYPNPFNPTTSISFRTRESAPVELTVCQADGRAVQRVLAGIMPPGEHTLRFDGSGLASGVYYYRLRAGDRALSSKMILCK